MHRIVAFIIGRLAWLFRDGLFPGDDPEVRAPNLDLTPHQHMRAHRQNVSRFYRNITNRNGWKDNMFDSMKANVRKIKRQHQILQAAQHRILQAAPRKLGGRLSFHLAQNLQSRRKRAIRANKGISRYMTRLIKSAAALHNILTYHFNEFHFSIRDEEDVEVIEVLHSLYPLHGPVVAHCLSNRLYQSFIRSSLEMGMAALH